MRRKLLYAAMALLVVGAVTVPTIAAAAHSHAAKKHKKTPAKTGPRGPRGLRGPPGAGGKTGASGSAGSGGGGGNSGLNGSAGANGAAGTNGASFLRTVIVSPSTMTATGNGALLLEAVAGLPTVNSGNPELISVEPGIYDLGTSSLSLPANVDLQGSGQDTTTIEGEGSLALTAAAGTEIRELTVSDTNAAGSAGAISTAGGLRDVTAKANGTPAATAVSANAPSMPIVDVTATATTSGSAANSLATAIGIENTVAIDGGTFSAVDNAGLGLATGLLAINNGASVSMTGATLEATGGAHAYAVELGANSQTVTIIGSTLTALGGLDVTSGSDTLDIGGSQIPGVITGAGNCPDDWLPGYVASGSACS